MATYTKRGKSTYAQVRITGHKPEGQSFPNKAQAVAWATQREQELIDGDAGKLPRKSLSDAVAKFKLEVCPTMKTGDHATMRLTAMLAIKKRDAGLAWLDGTKQLASFTVDQLTAWKDQRLRECKPGTVLREFHLLQSVFEHARRDWRWIKVNPCRDVRKPPKPAGKKVVIKDDWREQLLGGFGYVEGQKPQTLMQILAVEFLVALETGMRDSELTGLEWTRTFLDDRYLRLEDSKNGTAREVPLSNRAVELIRLMVGLDPVLVFPIKAGTRDLYFRRVRDRYKIPCTFHATRHTAATRIGRAGRLSLLEFCAMFGWKDPRQAMTYFNPTASELASKLD